MEALREWAGGIDLQWLLQQTMVVLAAVISLSFHECSHAFAAKRLGDDTAQRMGRLTLNPLRHVSWSGLLMLALFHFGWAKPVPVDMRRFRNPKTGMALTALAGPLSNVVLALLSCFAINGILAIGLEGNALRLGAFGAWALDFFYLLALLNAGLAVFNLIPISPLDGSKILAIVLPERAYAWLMRFERYGMLLLVALLLTGLLDTPLDVLRTGLLRGLYWLSRLPFGQLPNLFQELF